MKKIFRVNNRPKKYVFLGFDFENGEVLGYPMIGGKIYSFDWKEVIFEKE
jgi:hypothetical protein